MLSKVKKIKLKVIKNKSGDIIKYMDKKNPNFKKFGEVYFSKIKKGYVKGWNLHKKRKSLMTVPFGSITFVFKDYEMKYKKTINLNDKSPSLLVVPPNIWYKFWTQNNYSILMNFIDDKHNKNETKKLPL